MTMLACLSWMIIPPLLLLGFSLGVGLTNLERNERDR